MKAHAIAATPRRLGRSASERLASPRRGDAGRRLTLRAWMRSAGLQAVCLMPLVIVVPAIALGPLLAALGPEAGPMAALALVCTLVGWPLHSLFAALLLSQLVARPSARAQAVDELFRRVTLLHVGLLGLWSLTLAVQGLEVEAMGAARLLALPHGLAILAPSLWVGRQIASTLRRVADFRLVRGAEGILPLVCLAGLVVAPLGLAVVLGFAAMGLAIFSGLTLMWPLFLLRLLVVALGVALPPLAMVFAVWLLHAPSPMDTAAPAPI